MKLMPLAFSIALSCLPVLSHASNVIRMSAPISESPISDSWVAASPSTGNWVTTTSSGCVDSPTRSALKTSVKVQYQSCDAVTKTRTVQQRDYNARRNEYRDVGDLTTETQTSSTLNEPRYLDCRYNASSPATIWSITGAGNTLPQYVKYNGANLKGALSQFQLVSDGQTYLRGAVHSAKGGSSDAYTYYYVCKVLADGQGS